jgi:hypothetical protein
VSPGRAGAAVLYVAANKTNNAPDGTSWATAFPLVQQGINSANDGDEIWVAEATYFESVTLKGGVALYGGFAGGESQRGERNYTNHLSILDGGHTNAVMQIAPGGTNPARVDGFTLQNARGGLGGAVYSLGGSAIIVNNEFLNNEATNSGAAIAFYEGFVLIASNLIQGNVVLNFGTGGIELADTSGQILNNRIIGNSCVGSILAGGISCFGPKFGPFRPAIEIANNVLIGDFLSASTPSYSAGGIHLVRLGSARLVNNTIAWCGKPG